MDLAVLVVIIALVVAACDQKPNPVVEWPPMPGWEASDPHADAGIDQRVP